MGLDVTAYEKVTLELATSSPDESESDREDRVVLYVLRAFRAAADRIVDGVYSFSGEVWGFPAGSYGGYNLWRRHLSKMALGKEPEDVWRAPVPGPFVELINNADNEGVIGPQTSAKLAQDFAEWEEQARYYSQREMDGWFWEQYQKWRRAFEIAAKGGAVKLH